MFSHKKSSIAINGGVDGPKAIHVSQSINVDASESIELKVINKSELEDGYLYAIELFNGSGKSIKHIDVQFGFMLTEEARKTTTKFSFMLPAKPADSDINIKANEKRLFTVYWPKNIINDEMLNKDSIQIHFAGYFEQIDIEHSFGRKTRTDV